MNRRSSGFSVVGPEPEGPRYRGKRRESEQGPRTDVARPGPSKTGGKKRNLQPSGFPASTALAGFLHAKSAVGLSPRTLRNYDRYLHTWIEWAGDPRVNRVTADGIRNFLAWLRTEYEPVKFGGKAHGLSGKTVRNYHLALASFFAWASREFKIDDPTDRVELPRFQSKPIEPLTKEEVQAMVAPASWRSQRRRTAERATR